MHHNLNLRWKLICCLLYVAFINSLIITKIYAKNDSESKEDTDDTDVQYLYDVTLNESVETGSVAKVFNTKMIFMTKDFHMKIKKYSLFLVLSEDKTGVLAEIVVTKVSKKKKKAYARINRIAEGVRAKDLYQKPLISIDSLRDIMGNQRLFYENPLITIHYRQSSQLVFSVNQMTRSELNPLVSVPGVHAELYFPYLPGMAWLNWIGLSFYSDNIPETKIIARLPDSQQTRQAVISGIRQSASLSISPVFRDWWLRNLYLRAGLYNHYHEQFILQADYGEDKAEYQTVTDYMDYEAGFLINPVFNIYGGVSYSLSQGGRFESMNKKDNMPEKGAYQRSALSVQTQIRQPVSPDFRIDARVSFDRVFEASRLSEESAAKDTDQRLSDWQFTLRMGLSWSP